jgi:hypothetical protein
MRTRKDFIKDADTYIGMIKTRKKEGGAYEDMRFILESINVYCDNAVLENPRFDDVIFKSHIKDGLSDD